MFDKHGIEFIKEFKENFIKYVLRSSDDHMTEAEEKAFQGLLELSRFERIYKAFKSMKLQIPNIPMASNEIDSFN